MRFLVAAIVLAVACGVRGNAPAAAPSASPTASVTPTQNATPSALPTSSSSPTATRQPNPTAGPATYTSLALAYRVDMPSGWRRSSCQSSREPQHIPAIDTYTSASVDEEGGTDTGPAHDVVTVRVEDPEGKTPIQWADAGKMGFFSGSHYERTTFDGKEAARRVIDATGQTGAIAVAGRGSIYAMEIGIRSPGAEAAARALMLSLHVLSDAELAEAKGRLATPAPAPARSAEQVADTIARGFAQKDTAALASVSGDCLQSAAENAGASFSSTARYLAALRAKFPGITVAVRPRPIDQPQPGTAFIAATWTEAGTTRNAKMMLVKLGDTWYWDGVLFQQF